MDDNGEEGRVDGAISDSVASEWGEGACNGSYDGDSREIM